MFLLSRTSIQLSWLAIKPNAAPLDGAGNGLDSAAGTGASAAAAAVGCTTAEAVSIAGACVSVNAIAEASGTGSTVSFAQPYAWPGMGGAAHDHELCTMGHEALEQEAQWLKANAYNGRSARVQVEAQSALVQFSSRAGSVSELQL